MYIGSSSKTRAAAAQSSKPRSVHSAPSDAANSRRLVEDYWRSVLVSKHDPPLYHTLSDRYRGTSGIPFAARTDCSAVLRGHKGAYGASITEVPTSKRDARWLMGASDAALSEGDVQQARAYLESALTQIQNSVSGGATIASLTRTRSAEGAAPTAEILLRLGKLAVLCGEDEEGLRLLRLSGEADPLNPETYVLRAACYERLGAADKAYAEYENYLRVQEPTLEVVAHCGKCAAEAGNAAAAQRHLTHLLRLTEELEAAAPADEDAARAADRRQTASFYRAHANFYLGFSHFKQAGEGGLEDGARLREEAKLYFARATSNGLFIRSYEMHVDDAVMAGEFELAKESLQALQLMSPERADYYLKLAHICHINGDGAGELRALSDALDRQQSHSARRATLLARGTVYAELMGRYDCGIKDYTLTISLPSDSPEDSCTPLAYLRRAEAYEARQALPGRSATQRHEDREAALFDYERFLDSMQALRAQYAAAHVPFAESQVCDPQCLTDAFLTLAEGAFHRGDFSEATRFFSAAISRGWVPVPSSSCGAAATPAGGRATGRLGDQMYISLAHHVQDLFPVNEDMFKTPYEPREWVLAATMDQKRGKAQEKKEVDRATFSVPSLMYTMTDLRYNSLRALEPTVFTALELELLNLWEPYKAEVERTRDDVMILRSRKGKRHGA